MPFSPVVHSWAPLETPHTYRVLAQLVELKYHSTAIPAFRAATWFDSTSVWTVLVSKYRATTTAIHLAVQPSPTRMKRIVKKTQWHPPSFPPQYYPLEQVVCC